MQSIHLTQKQARRLLLARSGLLHPKSSGLPTTPGRSKKSALQAAHQIIQRFGYLQLDTVSIAGARSHALVLMSRLQGLNPDLCEELLQPGAPVFEYWGHEASWIPMEMYPVFAFRRKGMKQSPWWKKIIAPNKTVARNLKKRIREEGPLKSVDLEGKGSKGWWDLKVAKRVAIALWSSGELAIRERKRFQRSFDLPERVISKDTLKAKGLSKQQGIRELIHQAIQGHGVATTATLAQTWKLRNVRPAINRALQQLQEENVIAPCTYDTSDGRKRSAWIRQDDLAILDTLTKARFPKDRGVLLSPFDPVLWDRGRVMDLWGFHQVLEIYMPEPKRTYGYFCLPVLAGDDLIARIDLKADRKAKTIKVLNQHVESSGNSRPGNGLEKAAIQHALNRYAKGLGFLIR